MNYLIDESIDEFKNISELYIFYLLNKYNLNIINLDCNYILGYRILIIQMKKKFFLYQENQTSRDKLKNIYK